MTSTERPHPQLEEEGEESAASWCRELRVTMLGYPYLTPAHLHGFDQYKVSEYGGGGAGYSIVGWVWHNLHTFCIPIKTRAKCTYMCITVSYNKCKTSMFNTLQYRPVDTSPLSNYVIQPLWDFIVSVS